MHCTAARDWWPDGGVNDDPAPAVTISIDLPVAVGQCLQDMTLI